MLLFIHQYKVTYFVLIGKIGRALLINFSKCEAKTCGVSTAEWKKMCNFAFV
ncbi:unknown [Leyella stercorea CAG:629]|uniref:Uncharacterized protein n=1 Tax=Leyella stercorea CAG:629 TaxID=1263103 RepID=R7GXI5_9BACT|nr:unknown [Leyella stercorea CAG:629]